VGIPEAIEKHPSKKKNFSEVRSAEGLGTNKEGRRRRTTSGGTETKPLMLMGDGEQSVPTVPRPQVNTVIVKTTNTTGDDYDGGGRGCGPLRAVKS